MIKIIKLRLRNLDNELLVLFLNILLGYKPSLVQPVIVAKNALTVFHKKG